MALNVFLSHNTGPRDRVLVDWLAREAPGRGIRLYVAERDPRFGCQLSDKVKAAIRSAHCMLVLWTRDGAQSEWVNQEVGFAEQLGLLTIPIVERDARPKGFLEGKEYVELNRGDPAKAIQVAAEYLSTLRAQTETRNATLAVFGIVGLLFVLTRK